MTNVVTDLEGIRNAVAALAFARVDVTGTSSAGFIPLLDSLDAMIARWDGGAAPTADDHYRLGLMVGSVGYMAACRVNTDGLLEPMAMDYPDNPVAQAAAAMREAVLAFANPA